MSPPTLLCADLPSSKFMDITCSLERPCQNPVTNYRDAPIPPSKNSCLSFGISFSFYSPLQNLPSISNVNQLPVEMLREIFMKAVEVDLSSEMCTLNDPAPDDTLSNSTPCPVVLSQVCTFWRRVAASTPSLWSTIRVVPSSRYLSAQIHWTKLFLARAGIEPLDLVLKDCQSRSGSATSSGCREICATRSILSLLISRVRYWRTIDFHVSLEVLDMIFALTTSSKRYKCPNLRSASLLVSRATCGKLPADHLSSPINFINGTWVNPFLAATWRFLLSSPNMSEMTWWPGFHRVFLDPPVDMFDRLTRLNVHYRISAEELLHVLTYFPHVKEVIVTNLRLPSCPEDTARAPRLLLSSLETLHLKAAVEVGPLFDRLTSPSLHTLKLHYVDSMKPCNEDGLSLQRFLQGSECRLRKLAFYHKWDPASLEANYKTISMYLDSTYLRWLSSLEANGVVVHDAWRLAQLL